MGHGFGDVFLGFIGDCANESNAALGDGNLEPSGSLNIHKFRGLRAAAYEVSRTDIRRLLTRGIDGKQASLSGMNRRVGSCLQL